MKLGIFNARNDARTLRWDMKNYQTLVDFYKQYFRYKFP